VLLAVLFVFLYFIVQLRRRRAQLASEPIPTREQLDDRAYNQIHIARASAERLQRSGVDVSQVLALLDNAERARARGDPDTATALARSGQETLLRLRSAPPRGVPASAGTAATGASAPAPAGDGAWIDGRTGAAAPPTALPDPPTSGSAARLPKNKAESRFQLSLLDEDVKRAEASDPKGAGTTEGRTLLRDGQSAFERGDYTEALRLGLRGRRRVGARLETLAPTRSTQPEPDDDSEAPGPAPEPDQAGPATCANCGAPMKGADGFCRACGSPRSSARCGQCGEALAPDDRFCGACGGPIRS
jgi:double zinc ribbon protein